VTNRPDITPRPRIATKARLRWDAHSRKYALVYPERALLLNEVSAFILQHADGTATAREIALALGSAFEDVPGDAETIVSSFLSDLAARGLVLGVDPVASDAFQVGGNAESERVAPRPFTLICELTYKCPLRCAYCSNPTQLGDHKDELGTEDWERVLEEAAELGVLQVHFTGGEPLLRRDLERLVQKSRALGLFTNLITSALPRDDARLAQLCSLGLDNVQISIQDTSAEAALAVAGVAALEDKLAAARVVKAQGLPLTLNVVLHAGNIGRTNDFLALGEALGADRIELANTQYLGWALINKAHLLPSRAQLEASLALAVAAKARLLGKAEVLFVKPDHFGQYPRACMDGWGRRFLHISPDGRILPCHAAMSISTLSFPSARDTQLGTAWRESSAFQSFRGNTWMQEPCKTCDRREQDFGGCRCQAFALTGDAAATDPACSLSPRHGLIADLLRDRPASSNIQAPIVLRHHRGARNTAQ
jgi:PqqA peptide cyclase